MSSTILDRPPAPGASYTALPRLQQRTARSFVGASPPDPVAVWLMDQGFQPIGTSKNEHEYARFRRGDELVILYWNGTIVASGEAWQAAADRLAAICEEPPAQACLFDDLDEEQHATPPRSSRTYTMPDLAVEEYATPPCGAKGGAR